MALCLCVYVSVMKACTFMLMAVNVHHGGYLSTFFLIFQKKNNFWVFDGRLKVKICQKFEIFKKSVGSRKSFLLKIGSL